MTIFRQWQLARRAASAALINAPIDEAREQYVVECIGPAATASPMPTAPDCTADQTALDDVERQLTDHSPPWFLCAILAGLFIVETIGCALLMESLGFENPTRSILGLMFAALTFFLTYITARLGWTPAAAPGPAGGTGTRRWFYVALAAYAILVIAITVLRIEDLPGDEEGSRLYDLASAIVMMCATIGPAWLAELTMRRLVPVLPLSNQRSLHRRRIANAKRSHARAVAAAEVSKQRADAWHCGAEQIRAMYGTRYVFVDGIMKQVMAGRPIGSPTTPTPLATTPMPMLAPGVPETGGTP